MTGKNLSRLASFEAWVPDSTFYTKIANPLMSLRTTGSMTVERVAKPLKNYVFSKGRRRLNRQRASQLLRCGLNLRFLNEIKVAMKDKSVKFN